MEKVGAWLFIIGILILIGLVIFMTFSKFGVICGIVVFGVAISVIGLVIYAKDTF